MFDSSRKVTVRCGRGGRGISTGSVPVGIGLQVPIRALRPRFQWPAVWFVGLGAVKLTLRDLCGVGVQSTIGIGRWWDWA